MKKWCLLSFISCSLLACASADRQLLGSWTEPIPGMPGKTQGFRLEEGGKASSVNMATLLYESWEKEGNQLILKGKSIGNRQTIDFSSYMGIEEINDHELILRKDGKTVRYTRQP